ncbi:inositol monophosphatase family protein [Bacteroidota bacterium]
MNLENLCKIVIEIATSAAEYIRNERLIFNGEMLEDKGINNFVTHVDKQSEELLVKDLKKALPGAGFITEEGTANYIKSEYNWVIDPLDGTTNFIHGAPPYAISIGLLKDGKPELGVVYEITANECFHAHNEGKAYMNKTEIKVSSVLSVNDSLIATGFPYFDFSRIQGYFESMDYFMKNSHGLRRMGSAATDMAYVACGRYDAFFEYGLSPWDIVAGAVLVQRAGGVVSDFTGSSNYIFGNELIAANNDTYKEFQLLLNKFFKQK